ncbi:PilZ domain-containing protein [Maridesulfovibrio ferrireducens]|uniref:PilZ domain-containing protein n=1 Tax=Maridesulfovibrio ferrireducens TaxID=246191 RepID=A0A1G9JR55_9BACT|nr:PilZ domain-containing protein [Maridesulfovibrio ferrireducens]SDL39822.1 PilZ domain-containing protein [Maridesulfovibrio ferrireducens]
MLTDEKIPVIAFVDNPEHYQKSEVTNDLNIKYCASLDLFLNEVLEEKFAGLILDIQKVMKTPIYERNRIFSISAERPLIRTKIESNKAVFVDDPSNFKLCCREKTSSMTRINERVEVDIPILISSENDPAMANSFNGAIQNISESGCFINTDVDLFDQDFIYLRFDNLSNKLPIYAGIRWTKSTKDNLEGIGVKFITITEDQKSELLIKYIKPNLNPKMIAMLQAKQ